MMNGRAVARIVGPTEARLTSRALAAVPGDPQRKVLYNGSFSCVSFWSFAAIGGCMSRRALPAWFVRGRRRLGQTMLQR